MPSTRTSPVRVLVNASSALLGGGQTYLINLLRFLPPEFPFEIFVLAPDGLNLPQAGNILRVRTNWPLDNPLVRTFWEKNRLRELVRRLHGDVLFCPGGVLAVRPAPPCVAVTMFRNMIPLDIVARQKYPLGYMRLRHWALEGVLMRSMRKADLVICISDYARRVAIGRDPALAERTVVIPHGVSPEFTCKGHSRPAWLPEQGYLLYVSMLDCYKAHVEVVRGYDILRRRRHIREKLLFVGPERHYYGKQVRAEIARLGLQDHVLLTGPVPHEELPAVYEHAFINIFASECENCPNILLEALAAGRPLLASNRPPMPEFGGDAPIYFDPDSPSELADKLAAVMDNPALQRELSACARRQAEPYDWARTARRTWEAIYNLACSSAAGRELAVEAK